jgi:SAM-dependent methyltransferase
MAAYEQYYTHLPSEIPEDRGPPNLRQWLGNGYRDWRFRGRLSPGGVMGVAAAFLMPNVRDSIDLVHRYLPRYAQGAKVRVLDIGCGGGDYLELARQAGWVSCGVEPDPVARSVATARGFDVRPSLIDFDGEAEFDFATLSHVIEHVHDPSQILRGINALLRPGAALFVVTPNMLAVGHRIYGRCWRGLEPPRHLILFSRDSLNGLLKESGFGRIRHRPSRGALAFTALQSRRIADGIDPYLDQVPSSLRSPTVTERWNAHWPGRHSEFLTFTAVKHEA